MWKASVFVLCGAVSPSRKQQMVIFPAGDFRFHAPEITGFQAETFFEKDEAIPVSPEHGILLVIE